jgi:hypothetical protein
MILHAIIVGEKAKVLLPFDKDFNIEILEEKE